jgi:hypothetical protein
MNQTKDQPQNEKEQSIEYIDIKNERDNLIAAYNNLWAERLDYNDRKWETIRTLVSLTTGMLAAIGGITFFDKNQNYQVIGILGCILILFAVLIGIWTLINIHHESELQSYTEFSIFQIEKSLGLHKQITNPWLPDYPYIFGRKHRIYGWRTKEAYRVGKKGSGDLLEDWAKTRVNGSSFNKLSFWLCLICFSICLSFGVILISLAW